MLEYSMICFRFHGVYVMHHQSQSQHREGNQRRHFLFFLLLVFRIESERMSVCVLFRKFYLGDSIYLLLDINEVFVCVCVCVKFVWPALMPAVCCLLSILYAHFN